jgi:hypothetical protein
VIEELFGSGGAIAAAVASASRVPRQSRLRHRSHRGDSDGEDNPATDKKLLERQRTEMSNDGQLISSVR